MKLTFTAPTDMDFFDFDLLQDSDTLVGSMKNDRLRGEAGDDALYGRAGRDVLLGGEGADRFVFKSTLDSYAFSNTTKMDVILDFNRGQGDKLDLFGIDAVKGRAGNQAFSYIGTKDFTGKAGQVAWEKAKGGVYVGADTDGDEIPDFMVFLKGVASLTKGDFYL